jgi:hypothetical protein
MNDSPLERLLAELQTKANARTRRFVVVLSDHEAALSFAAKRNVKEKEFGPMTYGNRLTGLQAHIIGVVAEMAVAQHFGVEFDRSILPKGDNGIDLVLPVLGKTNVKCTTYDPPLLRVEVEHMTNEVDSYILVYVNPKNTSQGWLIGCATREEVKQGRKVQFVAGRPTNYVLEEHPLRGVTAC